MTFAYIFIGGGLGSMARYALSLMLKPSLHGFPWATLSANVMSCLVLGIVVGLGWKQQWNHAYLLLATGFCGGFSTFSTFTLESYQLFQTQQYGLFAINIVASLLACMLSLALGMWMVQK